MKKLYITTLAILFVALIVVSCADEDSGRITITVSNNWDSAVWDQSDWGE